jgi:hypothetical protein
MRPQPPHQACGLLLGRSPPPATPGFRRPKEQLPSGLHLLAGFLCQRRAEITFTGAATDCNNKLALVLRAAGGLERGPNVRAGRNARQDPFLERQSAGRDKSVLVADGDNLIHDLQVEVLGDEAGSGALNLVRSRLEGFAIPGLRNHR